MLRQRGFHEAKMRRVLAILQHHRDANDRLHPGLFGRILRVAEDYDTLARRSGKLSPTMALAAMQKWAGTRYDAVLLQLLVNALGAYPPGHAAEARGRADRALGRARPAPRPSRSPLARCLRLADGSPAPADLPLVDLRGAGPVHLLRGAPLTDRRRSMRTTVALALTGLVGLGVLPSATRGAAPDALESWMLGPFVRHGVYVLGPRPDTVFRCPVGNADVRWEEKAVFNPAAVVREGKVHLLYRAEDGVGEGTSRIGLATSGDGVAFERRPEPVLFPDDDFMMRYESEGGCEDPASSSARTGRT